MIYGIGTDIVKIERVKNVIERWGDKFLKRVFTEKEIIYCYKNKHPYNSFAARFAAKEAFIKSLGSKKDISFSEIEVLNDTDGKPSLIVYGKSLKTLEGYDIRKVHLSLSHDSDYSIAFVILEK